MPTIAECLDRRYPGDGLRADYRREIERACSAFLSSNMADPKFNAELTSGSDSKFWSCVSEALVYDRLKTLPFPPRSSIGTGPDFLLIYGAKRIWVEVVCPEPAGLPNDWVNIQTNRASWVPHDAILLRWTSAIKDKAEKLIGSDDGRVKGYLQSGAVSPDDVYVIVVNGCRLRHGSFSALHGVSQFPYAVEAVFPVGPYEIRIDRQTLATVAQGHQERFHISKPGGSKVPTQIFLDSRYAPVSAIWAVDFNGGSVVGNTEPSAIVYNPKASQPLPRGFLPADAEYVASPQGEDAFLLERLSPRAE